LKVNINATLDIDQDRNRQGRGGGEGGDVSPTKISSAGSRSAEIDSSTGMVNVTLIDWH
jgi:hypothetical protein